MAELEIKLEKRSQNERLALANVLLDSVYEEMLNGKDEGMLQLAVNIQVTVDRLVWLLNERMNKGE